jgi:hypothetical protein
MQNFFGQDTYMDATISTAMRQPGMQYKGGNGVSHDGKNIDVSSKLSLGSTLDITYGPLNLMPRPFLSVPYLGRGTVNPDIEIEMRKGLQYSNKKTTTNSSEKSYINLKYTPLLDEVQTQLSNPDRYDNNHCCGEPSREMQRDKK